MPTPAYPEFGTVSPKPRLTLVGENGNAFAIMSRAAKVLRRAGRADDVDAFMAEATAGDYDHVLQTCMRWFEVD
jgi:hypothetical protein